MIEMILEIDQRQDESGIEPIDRTVEKERRSIDEPI